MVQTSEISTNATADKKKLISHTIGSLIKIIDSISFGMMVVDKNKRILNINKAAVKMGGYDHEHELKGRNCYELLCPSSMDDCPILDEEQGIDNSDRILIRKDGSQIPILKSVVKTELKGEEVLLETFVDISDKKKAEEDLRASEERFRSIFESTSDCILVIDRNYRYLYGNQAAIDYVGLTREEFIGKTIRDVLGHNPDFMEPWEKRVDRIFKDGESFNVEDVVPINDTITYSESTISPIKDGKGNVFAAGIVYRDITKKKTVEKERELLLQQIENKNRELEEAFQMKEEFISALAHDIDNPIMAVKEYLTAMGDETFGELKDRQKTVLRTAITGLDRVSEIRKDTLMLSRLENGKADLDLRSVEIKTLVENIISEMNTRFVEKGQTVVLQMREDIFCDVDKKKLRRGIENYLTNASRYSPQNTEIIVDISRIDNMMRISVKDQGRGIKKDELKKIFERFYKTGRVVPGSTGLGLSIVKMVAELHEGRAWAESEGEGKGSTFYIDIPLD